MVLRNERLVLAESFERFVDKRDHDVDEDEEHDEAVHQQHERSHNSCRVTCFLVVHVHVANDEAHEGAEEPAVVVHERPECRRREGGKSKDESGAEDAEGKEATFRFLDCCVEDGDGATVAQDVEETQLNDEGTDRHERDVSNVGAH